MSEAKHTPGELIRDGNLLYVLEECRGQLRNRWSAGVMRGPDTPPEELEEIARRLVACWNACEGISTEALEAGATSEARDLLHDAIKLLDTERPDDARLAYDNTKDALAKLEGK